MCGRLPGFICPRLDYFYHSSGAVNDLMCAIILADKLETKQGFINTLRVLLQTEIERILRLFHDKPVNFRLLDTALSAYLPNCHMPLLSDNGVVIPNPTNVPTPISDVPLKGSTFSPDKSSCSNTVKDASLWVDISGGTSTNNNATGANKESTIKKSPTSVTQSLIEDNSTNKLIKPGSGIPPRSSGNSIHTYTSQHTLTYIEQCHRLSALMELPVDNIMNLCYKHTCAYNTPAAMHTYMLGSRGARCCIIYPELLQMQIQAIIGAAITVSKEYTQAGIDSLSIFYSYLYYCDSNYIIIYSYESV